MEVINIVGAGFVGLTLAEVLSDQRSMQKINVIDVNESRINNLNSGVVPIDEPDLHLKSEKLNFTTSYDNLGSNIFFICVGTPDKGDGSQNMEYIESAIDEILNVCDDPVIILKSTTLPENVAKIKYRLGDNIKFITNPEFLAEGSAVHDLYNQNQLIIGADYKFQEFATNLLTNIFSGTFKEVSTVGLYEAMTIKYMVNSYKAMKLTFINDFADYCRLRCIDFGEVIKSINDPVLGKGFDKPGVGFGGSCFPKDTHAIGKYVESCKFTYFRNEARIKEFAKIISLQCSYLGIQSPSILIIGKSFKPGTNDLRESVAVKVGGYLDERKIKVTFYDPISSISDLTLDQVKDRIEEFDLVLIMNDIPELSEIIPLVRETRIINTRKFN
jgi:UDPglucose 6-dehydrogenase